MNIGYVKPHLECSYSFNVSNRQFVEFRFDGEVCLSDRVQRSCQFCTGSALNIEDFAFHRAIGEKVDDDLRLLGLHDGFVSKGR